MKFFIGLFIFILTEIVATANAASIIVDGGNGGGLGKEIGQFSSIALDSKGYPHISYWSGYDTHSLRYAYYDGSIWRIETVDNSGYAGEYTSLVLDNNDHPHISYYGATNLKYAYYNGATWHIETVDKASSDGSNYWEGKYTSIVLDSSAKPQIGYIIHAHEKTYALRYAKFNGTSWNIQTVDQYIQGLDSPPGSMYDTFRTYGEEVVITYRDVTLNLDANEYPHITYYDPNHHSLKHTWFNGTIWNTEIVDNQGGRYASSKIDNTGKYHVAYSNDFSLKYAYYNGSVWNITTIDDIGVNWFISLDVDNNNHPRISYFDYSTRNLKYAWFDGSVWHKETTDLSSGAGWYSSLVLDSTGNAHISYHDSTTGALKYVITDGTGTEITKGPEQITGTPPNYTGDTIINIPSVWKNTKINLFGHITINSGGSLTLDNTILFINGVRFIRINQGGVFRVLNNSVIDSDRSIDESYGPYNNHRAFGIYAGTVKSNSPWDIDFAGGLIQADSSAFLNTYVIELAYSPGDNYFHNVFFRDIADEASPKVSIQSFMGHVDIINSTFLNNGAAVQWYSSSGKYDKSLTRDTKHSIYTIYAKDIRGTNSITEDVLDYSNFNIGVVGTNRFHIKNNLFINSRGSTISNGENYYGLFEGTISITDDPSFNMKGGPDIGPGTYRNFNNIYRNIGGTYSAVVPRLGEQESGRDSRNKTVIYNVTSEKNAFSGWSGTMQDSLMFDAYLNSLDGSRSGIYLKVGFDDTYPIALPDPTRASKNNIYANIRLNHFRYGIETAYSQDLRFIDIKLEDIFGYDIWLRGNNSNLKFININYRENKILFDENTDIFKPYWYCDVNVVDGNGNPVPDAVVNVTNEADSAYTSINRLGQAKTSFYTTSNGHTPLPVPYKSENLLFSPPIQYDANGDLIFLPNGQWYNWSFAGSTDSDTVVLGDYIQTKSTKTNYTYAITATYGAKTATVTGVDPDQTWHRSDPSVPTKTVTLTLPAVVNSVATDKIKIYPNPYIAGKSETNKIIFAGLSAEAEVEIYNVSGKLIQKLSVALGNKAEWNIANVSSGVYLYVITSSEGVKKGKVSVIK